MNISEIGRNIAFLRKNIGFTQEELAEKLGVTAQAVSKWENGHNLPDIENLMYIAELLNLPYSALLSGNTGKEISKTYNIRGRLFHEDNMFTRMRTFALSEKLTGTYKALQYMRKQHIGQFRKQGKYTTEQVQYINHPLMMACQAHALGIRDDNLLAAILLHDVVEDTGVDVQDLPFAQEVQELVGLVSFSIPEGMTKEQAKELYYEKIKENGKACVVKTIDRCNNISTMAGSFSKEQIARYIAETEEYIFPLLDVLKNEYSEYSDMAFLIKYQMRSILETIKCLSIDDR
ncbi:MAG: helix-turn-helix domain-containing protein [Lachnospiraceae bacterium]